MSQHVVAEPHPSYPAGLPTAGLWRTLLAGVIGGWLSGVLVAGLGGRVVMRILAVTSSDQVQGLLTDDQAAVGDVSFSGTLTLAFVGGIAGSLGGLGYLLALRILPTGTPSRMVLFGLFGVAVGGGMFVHDFGSFDYSRLDPAWLAVLSFLALPGSYGMLVPLVVDRLLRPGGLALRAPLWALWLVALPSVYGVFVMAVSGGGAEFVRRSSPLSRMWRSRTVTWLGWAMFVTLIALGLIDCIVDVASVARQQPDECLLCVIPG